MDGSDRPVARSTDPWTSWDAAASVRHVRESQQAVLDAFREFGPMTDLELISHIDNQSESGIRTRRSELVDKGLITESGQYRLSESGRKMTVWMIPDATHPVHHTVYDSHTGRTDRPIARVTRVIEDEDGITVEAEPIPRASTPGMEGRNFPLARNEDGSIEVVWQVCPDCGCRYAIHVDHLVSPEHKRWLARSQTLEGQTSIPDEPQPEVWKFTEMPPKIDFGVVAVCPRCKNIRRRAYTDGHGHFHPAEDLTTDPRNHKVRCTRCNGFGVVPNSGPVQSEPAP